MHPTSAMLHQKRALVLVLAALFGGLATTGCGRRTQSPPAKQLATAVAGTVEAAGEIESAVATGVAGTSAAATTAPTVELGAPEAPVAAGPEQTDAPVLLRTPPADPATLSEEELAAAIGVAVAAALQAADEAESTADQAAANGDVTSDETAEVLAAIEDTAQSVDELEALMDAYTDADAITRCDDLWGHPCRHPEGYRG